MENFTLELLAQELRQRLVGRKLLDVTAAATTTFWRFEGLDGALKISPAPARPVLYLTRSLPNDAHSAHLFEDLLDQRLHGLDKPPAERLVRLEFAGREIVVELIPHRPQLFILDAGVVRDVWLHQSPRRLDAGEPYVGPARRGAADPLETLEKRLSADFGATAEWILSEVPEVGPEWAQELERRLRAAPDQKSAVRQLREELRRPPACGYVCSSAALNWKDFSVAPATEYPSWCPFAIPERVCQTTETLNDAADLAETFREQLGVYQTTARLVRQSLAARRKNASALHGRLADTLRSFERADQYRKTGDLLLAHLGTLRNTRVPEEVELADYFDPEARTVTVPLDPDSSWQGNAEQYYRRFQKAVSGRRAVERRIQELEEELGRLGEIERRAQSAADVAQLEQLATQLQPKRSKRTTRVAVGRGKQEEQLRVRRIVSADGLDILIGRSNRENDELTFKVARPNDLWLHAADYPGSHVVVRNPGKGEIPMRTLLEAARWAAYYSKAREETRAAVNYTQRKFVQRPRGTTPGKALMTRFKTVVVEPARDTRDESER
ncbi:MAG: NFACT RNA binding domain-containing protein [Acidobacteriota bacterium]